MHSDSAPGTHAPAVLPATLVTRMPCGRSDAVGVALAREPASHGPPDLTAAEWDELFEAVRSRLERAVASIPVAEGNDAAAQADVDLRECVEALGQLQVLLAPERERLLRQDLQVIDLQCALALAIGELADAVARTVTPAGAPMPTTSDG